MTTGRRVTAEDLYLFDYVGDCQLAPDGRHVLYAVQRVDRKTEKKYTNIWLAATDGGGARPFTSGDHADTQPRWSPDGRQIAFVSNRDDDKQPQIYLIPLGGGEARRLTELKGAFGDLEWSPDGRQILFAFRRKDAETLEREADPQKKELGVVARRFTRVFFKEDGAGYLPAERWHLCLVDVPGGEVRQLTDGAFDERDATWSPDGATILFASNRSDDPDFNPEAVAFYTIPAAGGKMTEIPLEHPFQKFSPRYSPDGRWIAYVGRRTAGNWWQNTCLYLAPATGGPVRNLTEAHDLHVSSATTGDVPGRIPMMRPTWSPDSRTLYTQVSRHGSMPLVALDIAGDEPPHPTPVVPGPGTVGAFGLDAAGEMLAYWQATMTDPGTIWARRLDGGEACPLTAHNAWLAEVELGQIEEVWIDGASSPKHDSVPLHGWVLRPPGFDPAQTYPTIIEIHGGPQMQYGHTLGHEFQTLAAAGYIVAFCNPRGSQGYGDAFSGAIYNDWGTIDFDDLMVWTDYVAALPEVDAARMGVTGGSYGGYMTGMIVGRSHRFKAAVAQRMVSNLISMWGSSDFNWAWTRAWGDETPWENLENYWRVSPMRYVGGALTPTMVIHSENDYRCNQEQGEQFYVALKKLGVPAEFILFPGESHGLSRGGRTDRRIARLGHIQRWMDAYLKEADA